MKAAGAGAKAHDARMCDQLAGQIAIIATPQAPALQERFLITRFGLPADRARLVAGLLYGEAR